MNGSQQAALGYGDPSFKIVINLAEVLGEFDRELGADIFEPVQESFNDQAAMYIARGLIHNVLGIPGALSMNDALAFFPPHIRGAGTQLLDTFWRSLSADISRTEQMISAQNPGQQYEVCHIPAPMITGCSTLTLWYRWLSGPELAQRSLDQLADIDGDNNGDVP